MFKSKNSHVIIAIIYFLTIIGLLLFATTANLANAQPSSVPKLLFEASLSKAEVALGTDITLRINIKNIGGTLVQRESFHLFLTEGLALAAKKEPHLIYEPVLSQQFALDVNETTEVSIPLHLYAYSERLQGLKIVYAEEVVVRLEVPVEGQLTQRSSSVPSADYQMPTPPTVTCPPEPSLSAIGLAASDAYNSYYLSSDYTANTYFSSHTWCNRLAGDWILDIPNVHYRTHFIIPGSMKFTGILKP